MEKTIRCIYVTSASSSSWDQLEMVLILVLPVKQTTGPPHSWPPPRRCRAMQLPQSSPPLRGGMRPRAGCAEPRRLPKSTAWLEVNFCSFFSCQVGAIAQQLLPAPLPEAAQGHCLLHCWGCRALGPPLEPAPLSCSALVPQLTSASYQHRLPGLRWAGFH